VRSRGRYEPLNDETSNVERFMSWNSTPDPERQAFTGELRDLLEWAIDTLPDGAREVFVHVARSALAALTEAAA